MQHTKEFWYAIINPVSGQGKGLRTWPKVVGLLEAHGLAYHPEITQGPEHARELLLAGLQSGYRRFLLVGGDGTFSEAVNGLFSQQEVAPSEVVFAMVPAGTGNDWHRGMHAGSSLKQIVKWMADARTRREDIGKVSFFHQGLAQTRYFFNVAGMGFDAYVAARYLSPGKGLGILSYMSGVLRGLFSFRKPRVTVTFDGKKIESPVFILAVGIGRFFGGGMMIAPDAIPDDGLFDLTLVKDITKLGVISQLPRLYKGTFTSHPQVSQFRTKKLEVQSAQPLYLQLDGEMVGHSPATFEIIPQVLNVITGT